jgi:type VI secretion system secreted protein VgrG
VPQILDQVLKEHGITGQDRRFELDDEYAPRDFCTQYRESDLQFVQRLCAQERLHYHFEHRAQGHCVVFGDGQGAFRTGEPAVFQAKGEHPAVRRFEVQRGVDETKHSAEGNTDMAMLRSGQLLPLSGLPVAGSNQPWLLTHVEHQGSQDPDVPYSNQVRAIRLDVPFESPHGGGTPKMHSLQRAWVVDVDEPRPDPRRTVAVQFDWLYQGEGAAPSHCWLPLAPELQAASGAQLSEGAEVVVSFIEGDPDQPLITGFLHAPKPVEAGEAADVLSQSAVEDCPPEGMQDWLRSGAPLLLLCLLPGGGSFNHCAQTLCTCRAATGLGQSGAA